MDISHKIQTEQLSCAECFTGEFSRCYGRYVAGLSKDEGIAEYVIAGEQGLIPISKDMDFETAALCEPLAVAVR